MIAYTTFGVFWCPRCACRREFVSDDPNQKDANFGECVECGYVHGYVHDEVSGTSRPTLSRETIDRARDKQHEQWKTMMVSSGVRLEALEGKARHRLKKGTR